MTDNGFERERSGVGPGWQPLIEQLHADLLKVVPQYSVVQIKEKFGGLRYYIAMHEGHVSDQQRRAAWDLTDVAETASYTICETCGTTEGVTTRGSWRKTACPEHHAGRRSE